MVELFRRWIDELKRRIFLIIGRGVVYAINNETKIQKIQITGLNSETLTDIERPQNYGFESYPDVTDAEAVIAYIGGNRDQGLALVVHDRENRPDDLEEGDVRLYTTGGQKIDLKSDGSILITSAAGQDIDVQPGLAGFCNLGKLPTQLVNNLPTCIISGGPHSTSLDVKA